MENGVIVPFHNSKNIAIGTLYKQSGLSIDEFNSL
ncbi:MAG: type II toxin-antitoxin system HicA family toxin [Candidatus Paceibacterota bacterium]